MNYWPQLDFDVLDAIESHNPGIKFLLNTRDTVGLISSITRWATLRRRISQSEIIGLPAGKGMLDEELAEWIEGHFQRCRERFHGTSNFLEFDIADPSAREQLEDFLDLELPWWGVANANVQVPADKAEA